MFEKIFSYEAPLYQFLLKLSRILALNLLFLLCCLPIVTVGAAQAGMMNAARVIQDPSDDSSCFRAFFRGFSSGFWKISVIWTVCLVLMAGMAYVLYVVLCFDAVLDNAPVAPAVLGLALLILFQTMSAVFHSRFDCPPGRLLRNGFFLILMHPLRSVCITLLTWAPAAVLVFDTVLFVRMTPLWLLGYYGLIYQLNARLIRKPFSRIEEQAFPEAEDTSPAAQP